MTTTLKTPITTFIRARRTQGRYNPKTVRVVTPRLRTLDTHFGSRPLPHLNRRAIEAWLGTLEHLATNSRAAYMASVRQFTAWLVLEQLLAVDPCTGILPLRRARSVPRSLTASQAGAVLGACENDRDRAIVWLELGLGMRRAEVAAARWEDYDERAGLLLVHGKGQKERVLPVVTTVAAALGRVRSATSGPIVRSRTDPSRGLMADTIGERTTELFQMAGVKRAAYDGMSGHALRHTCATDVLDFCGDLRVVMELLGHDNLATTSRYTGRASHDRMRSAMEGRTYPASFPQAA